MIFKFNELFYRPMNPSVVAVYRIFFGLFMVYQMLYYFSIDYTYQFMAGPEMLFHYEWLTFLKPLPVGILQLIHVLLLVAALFIAIGWYYRQAMVFFFLGFTYFTFVDKTLFNNHLYLISLLAFVMIFIKADVKYSLRAWKRPSSFKPTIPAWNQYLLIFLISLPYFFGGIAKLGFNWMDSNLVAELVSQSKPGAIKNLFSEEILVSFLKYGGLLYDLGIVWLLLFRRTRVLGVVLVVIFNLTNNSFLFDDIGIFPFFMICSTILFFNAEKVGAWLGAKLPKKKKEKALSKKQQKRLLKEQKRGPSAEEDPKVEQVAAINTSIKYRNLTTAMLCFFVLFQLVFPLRHYAFTHNPEWYGAGMFFSWRMKMQTKEIVKLEMTLANTETQDFGPIEAKTFLSSNQYAHLLDDPDNLILLAKYLTPKAQKEYNINKPAITADIVVRFNGMPSQQMIQPDVDLSKLNEEDVSDRSWIIPLQK